jgi:hypothetical protein
MPTLPADEDYARALLSIFQSRRLQARQSLRESEVREAFLGEGMGRPFDFDAALDYAISQGWFWRGFGSLRLTSPGDEEMHTISLGRGMQPKLAGRRPPPPSLRVAKSRA